MSPPRNLHPNTSDSTDAEAPGSDSVREVEFSQTPTDELRAVSPRAISSPLSQPRRVGAHVGSGWSPIVRWGSVAVAVFIISLIILTWSALRATERGEAEPLIARALVSLTEIDALLDSGHASLLSEAKNRPRELLTLPHYPLPVSLGAEEIAVLSREEFRARLLSVSATLVYADGTGAFRRESSMTGDGLFSARSVIRWTVGALTENTHEILWLALAIMLMMVAPTLIIVVAASEDRNRLRNLGLIFLIGGVWMVITSLSARFALQATANGAGDPLNKALLDIGADTLPIVLRNAVIVMLLGLSLLALSVATRAAEGGFPGVRSAISGNRRNNRPGRV